MSIDRYTLKKYQLTPEDTVYWAEMEGPSNGQSDSEVAAVEKLADNLERIVADIRGGEIAFKRMYEEG